MVFETGRKVGNLLSFIGQFRLNPEPDPAYKKNIIKLRNLERYDNLWSCSYPILARDPK